jgi:(p)ppGpp synthase/HD superfamily hydrolase
MTESHLPAYPGKPTSGERFERALATAAQMHAAQTRKSTEVPYVSHLLGTCSIALQFGADEDQAIAALLHDSLEDIKPSKEVRRVLETFGTEVLRIVEGCTDTELDPKPPWRDRKQAYIARLAREDAAILLVSASDKLHNARTIVDELHREGPAMLRRFNAESDQVWYYRSLVDAFRANPAHQPDLIDALQRTVDEMARLVGDETSW